MEKHNLPDLPRRDEDAGVPAQRTEPGSLGRYDAGTPDAGRSSGLEWDRYLSTIRRYKWVIALVTLLGTVAGLAVAYWLSPRYLAQATLWVEWRDQRGQQIDHGPIRSSELLQSYNWLELLKSYAVLEHVTREMRLYLHPQSHADTAALATFDVDERFTPGRYRVTLSGDGRSWAITAADSTVVEEGAVGEPIGRGLGFRWAPSAEELAASAPVEFSLDHPRDAARELGQRLDTWMLEQGSFLRIELAGDDPARTAAIVNAVAHRFIDLATELKRARVDQLTLLLEDQLASARENLEGADADLEGFRVRTIDQPSLGTLAASSDGREQGSSLTDRFHEMQFRAEDLRRDRRMIASALERARSGEIPVEFLHTIPAVQGSSVLSSAIQSLYEKRAELRALDQLYTDEHPDVQRLRLEVREMEERTIPEMARSLEGQLGGRLVELEQEIESTSTTLRQIPPRATEEARLRRRAQNAADLYTNLEQRFEEARLAAASTLPDVRILDPAEVGRKPISDERPQVIAMAFLGSLGLALVGALLFDRFDPRVRYPEHVSEGMGVRILGTIPHLRAKEGVLDQDGMAGVTEAFRTLRLNLAHAHGAAGPLITTVTSPSPGDGKSFVSLNLALTMARLGRKTLLIDGDTRRGRLHRALERRRKPGLTDYLANGMETSAVIQGTEQETLHFIAGGVSLGAGPELLQSARMRDLIADARSRYDAVIVDSPPLSAGVDPLVLATFTGSLLLVLRAGMTNRALAEAKLDLMTPLPIRILGAVLNDVSPTDSYYEYYRTYTPGYEARDEALEKVSVKLLAPTGGTSR